MALRSPGLGEDGRTPRWSSVKGRTRSASEGPTTSGFVASRGRRALRGGEETRRRGCRTDQPGAGCRQMRPRSTLDRREGTSDGRGRCFQVGRDGFSGSIWTLKLSVPSVASKSLAAAMARTKRFSGSMPRWADSTRAWPDRPWGEGRGLTGQSRRSKQAWADRRSALPGGRGLRPTWRRPPARASPTISPSRATRPCGATGPCRRRAVGMPLSPSASPAKEKAGSPWSGPAFGGLFGR